MQKHIPSAILAALLALSALSACASDTQTTTDTTAAPTTTAPTAEAETTQSEKERLLAALPTGDFTGEEFRILNCTVGWADTDFSAEDLTGESLNDALFKRDETIKDKLGVTVVEERDTAGNITNRINISALAQDGAYQAAINQMGAIGTSVQQDVVDDMSTYSALQFDMPWWNSELIERINFGKKTPILFGDFHIGFPTSHYIIAFNKGLIEENGLEEPYALMAKNEWTWDKMYEMMNVVARDVNGDGQYTTKHDIYGIGNYSNAPKNFIMSAEVNLLTFNADGIPTFTATTDERYLTAWEKMMNLFCLDERMVSMPGINGYSKIDGSTDGYKTLFAEGRLLFYHEVIGTLRDMRESEEAYGIVPHPKYDASQTQYYSPINPSAMTMIVPRGNKNPEMVGVVLENIAAYSHYAVMPIFVETTLHYKFARDEQSIETLNAILASNMIELAYCYNWGGVFAFMDSLVTSGKTSIASQLKTFDKLITQQIQKTVDVLMEE